MENEIKKEELSNDPALTISKIEDPKSKVMTSSLSSLNGPFPKELNHWNWGAFLLVWIWAIGNKTWIGLLGLISPISLIMAIILGIKGNEWAWQNKKFESVEQFKKVQNTWTLWAVIAYVVPIVGIAVYKFLCAISIKG